MTVSMDDARGNYSTSVDIPINVSGASDVGAMDISLMYDPSVLSPTGIVNTGDLTADLLVINDNTLTDDGDFSDESDNQTVWDYGALANNTTATSGVVNISIINRYGFNGAGSVAMVRFNVIGSDVESPLNLSVAAYNVGEPIVNTTTGNVTGYESIPVTPLNGTFTAEESDGHTSDFTADGFVNTDDVVYMVVNLWGACTAGAEGDFTADGFVNTDDVVYMVVNLWGTCP